MAGMRADTEYKIRSETISGEKVTSGEYLSFHTGMLDGNFPPVDIAVPASSDNRTEPVIIHSAASLGGPRATLCNRSARTADLVSPITGDFLTRVLPGGHFLRSGRRDEFRESAPTRSRSLRKLIWLEMLFAKQISAASPNSSNRAVSTPIATRTAESASQVSITKQFACQTGTRWSSPASNV